MHHVADREFADFGRIVTAYDFAAWLTYLDTRTTVPGEGNVYVASEPGLEALAPFAQLRDTVYGGLDIQAGYCNGLASRLNGLEYHKSPEFFVTQTELVLLLAPYRAMRDFTLDAAHVRAFYFPAGTAVELFGSTLHFAPSRLSDAGFKSAIVLLRGTNTDPPPDEQPLRGRSRSAPAVPQAQVAARASGQSGAPRPRRGAGDSPATIWKSGTGRGRRPGGSPGGGSLTDGRTTWTSSPIPRPASPAIRDTTG